MKIIVCIKQVPGTAQVEIDEKYYTDEIKVIEALTKKNRPCHPAGAGDQCQDQNR